jgi:pyridoxine/pyridoxamine 5'-phosphate oxidase
MTCGEFADFVRVAGMGVVATAGADGNPEAALVDLAATDAGEIIFDTAIVARKVANIAANPRVRIYTERFPGSRALRAEFAIIRVTPRWLRYYDARPGSFRVAEGNWPGPEG